MVVWFKNNILTGQHLSDALSGHTQQDFHEDGQILLSLDQFVWLIKHGFALYQLPPLSQSFDRKHKLKMPNYLLLQNQEKNQFLIFSFSLKEQHETFKIKKNIAHYSWFQQRLTKIYIVNMHIFNFSIFLLIEYSK